MSKRSKFAAASASPSAAVALGSTGSARRDKVTQSAFARLCARIPLLAVNAPAQSQLTHIVFDGLAQLRAQEDRSAELCEGALTPAGCSLCSWVQASFCESCGTDFKRTPSKAGYPLFLPVFDAGKLHIDLAMACSEACVTKLMEQKEKLLAEKEAAKAAKNGSNAAAAAASSVRVQASAKDPHQTLLSLLFHSAAYALTLYALFATDLTLSACLSEISGWSLMLSLLAWALWMLNLMMTFTAGGAFRSVARIRQALAAVVSMAAVCSAVAFLTFVGFTADAGEWEQASGSAGIMRPSSSAAPGGLAAASAALAASAASLAAAGAWGQVVQQLTHTMPVVLMGVEVMMWPHEKMNPWLERVLCVLPPSLFVLVSYHTELLGLARTDLGFVAWLLPLLGALIVGALTRGFQALRDWRWKAYVVPKHLMINP